MWDRFFRQRAYIGITRSRMRWYVRNMYPSPLVRISDFGKSRIVCFFWFLVLNHGIIKICLYLVAVILSSCKRGVFSVYASWPSSPDHGVINKPCSTLLSMKFQQLIKSRMLRKTCFAFNLSDGVC